MEQQSELIEVATRLNELVEKYESTIEWKKSGDMADRVQHVMSQYRQIADNAIYETKRVHSDVKTQFKALEIITEGLTSDGLNHGQKRTIANYIITMLRKSVDIIDQYEYNYSTHNFERYNFFRSESPEKRVYEERRELKRKSEEQEKILKTLAEVHPDIYKSLTKNDEIPF